LVLACAAVAAVTAAGILVYRVLSGAGPVTSACTVAVGSTSGRTFKLDPEQAQNASIIAAVGSRLGMPDHAVTVALATALQESKLRDLPYGDLDSVGLFQQRPSQGWGTRDHLLDPVFATTAFYGRLVQVAGWQTMAVTDAAQAVQHSADANAYAQWDAEARSFAISLTGEAPEVFTCHLAGFSGPAPSPTALATAAASETGSSLAAKSLTTKAGWAAAYWVVAHAWKYHVHQVAYDGWMWTPQSGRWRQTSSNPGPAGQVSYS
jgi:hypothetical protein